MHILIALTISEAEVNIHTFQKRQIQTIITDLCIPLQKKTLLVRSRHILTTPEAGMG